MGRFTVALDHSSLSLARYVTLPLTNANREPDRPRVFRISRLIRVARVIRIACWCKSYRIARPDTMVVRIDLGPSLFVRSISGVAPLCVNGRARQQARSQDAA